MFTFIVLVKQIFGISTIIVFIRWKLICKTTSFAKLVVFIDIEATLY